MAIFLIFATIVAILWVGAQDVHAGSMTGGRLGQFVLYAVLAGSSLGTLSEVWGEIQQAAGATERLTELLAVKSQIKSPENPRPMTTPAKGIVTFENVQFAYPTRPDQPALNDVSFEVRAGETVAIVGASGSGKSTLFALLLRFYDPSQGHIKIDDNSIREVDLEILRRQISYVSQSPDVFDDSVADNIRFGAPDVSMERYYRSGQGGSGSMSSSRNCRHPMRPAWARRVRHYPEGSGSVSLSPELFSVKHPFYFWTRLQVHWIPRARSKFQIALERVKKDRTTLVIAHRLSTVPECR